MRIPVPRSRLVTLSILAALITAVVTVGLANPSMLPGTDTVTMVGAPAVADAGLDEAGTAPTKAQEEPAEDASEDVSAADTSGADTPTAPVQAAEQPPVTAAAPPTPNPNFTPAVGTATPNGGQGDDEEGGHEWWEHDDEDEWDDD